MNKTAKLDIDGHIYELPLIEGTEGEKALDVGRLRAQSGYITLDPAFANTGACQSAISFIDGELGTLRYRGIDIAELCEKSTFMEVSYLLIYGHLPGEEEYTRFKEKVHHHSLIHEDMKSFFTSYPGHAHPMAILSAMVCSLSVYHPELLQPEQSDEDRDQTITHLLSKVRVLAAFAYKRSVGEAFVYTRPELDYLSNFMHMMFTTPMRPFEPDEVIRKALDVLFILHADHEQNCSTSTVRMVGSSKANLFAALSAGICALWGPLHGGANQAVIEMLESIHASGSGTKRYVDMAKDKGNHFKLMGFGHRVYKKYDPRAAIIKKYCDQVLNHLGIDNPILEIAKELEEAALTDDYFIERQLYPNVDFYSGIIYRALKIPTNMFTVMFALGRLPGWIAHWKELVEDPGMKIARPRQIYTGSREQQYLPIDER
ncbi:citrate synthase [Candidatus Methylospira mobilis]|uniref:Citrate synthase n=1 Tax=Candidatus Methylospira mobilis TaxID=1808979 RepID=A0A5Q0BLG3_9GAMM|nr:citrate synthase [Candidatus Methylospira mobilis]QFY43051.1 citrate synthase [Candidatus Methylospira mobilis]